jgi:hypothetical protein
MVLSTDQKVNMSLDDIVKMSQKDKPAKKAGVIRMKSAATNKTAAANKSAAPKKVGRPRRNSKGGARMEVDEKSNKSAAKAAKSAGAVKAKREAAVNQRRGLSTTAKPTKAAVKAAVNKQMKKPLITKVKPSNQASLKISFKPSELAKTTDKNVSAQIKAVLSKQTGGGAKSGGGMATAGKAAASKKAVGVPRPRRVGPKSRGRN